MHLHQHVVHICSQKQTRDLCVRMCIYKGSNESTKEHNSDKNMEGMQEVHSQEDNEQEEDIADGE